MNKNNLQNNGDSFIFKYMLSCTAATIAETSPDIKLHSIILKIFKLIINFIKIFIKY